MSELDSVEKRKAGMPAKENVLLIFGGFPIAVPKPVESAKVVEKAIGIHACQCINGGTCPVCSKNCHHEPSTMIAAAGEEKRRRNWKWLVIPLIFLLLLVPLAWLLPWDARGPSPTPTPQPGQPSKVCFETTINETCCNVQLSLTREEHLRGLRFLQTIEPNGCMLYILGTPDEYQFWTKDMNFPIDLILITPDRRVTEVDASLPPCTVPAGSTSSCPLFGGSVPISYAIEANSGYAASYGISVGNPVRFEY